MHTLKKMIYRLGFRPKNTSIWFSPSLCVKYYFRDVEIRRQKDRWDKGYGI